MRTLHALPSLLLLVLLLGGVHAFTCRRLIHGGPRRLLLPTRPSLAPGSLPPPTDPPPSTCSAVFGAPHWRTATAFLDSLYGDGAPLGARREDRFDAGRRAQGLHRGVAAAFDPTDATAELTYGEFDFSFFVRLVDTALSARPPFLLVVPLGGVDQQV